MDKSTGQEVKERFANAIRIFVLVGFGVPLAIGLSSGTVVARKLSQFEVPPQYVMMGCTAGIGISVATHMIYQRVVRNARQNKDLMGSWAWSSLFTMSVTVMGLYIVLPGISKMTAYLRKAMM